MSEERNKRRPEHEHLYWRVVDLAGQPAEDGASALSALVQDFAAGARRSHVRLLQPPELHPRGGWALHFDLKEGDKMSLVQFLHAKGWAGVV